jgi:hypothetical protein
LWIICLIIFLISFSLHNCLWLKLDISWFWCVQVIRRHEMSYSTVVVNCVSMEGTALGSSLHALLTVYLNRISLLITAKMWHKVTTYHKKYWKWPVYVFRHACHLCKKVCNKFWSLSLETEASTHVISYFKVLHCEHYSWTLFLPCTLEKSYYVIWFISYLTIILYSSNLDSHVAWNVDSSETPVSLCPES